MSDYLDDARAWISDCTDEFDPAELSDAQVRRLVEREYAGGWDGFTSDADGGA